MSGFEVEPASFSEAGSGFDTLSTDLTTALESLRGSLAGAGEPWGDDDPGQAFAGGYEPNARTLLDSVAALADGLQATGRGLVRMGGNYGEGEQASTIPGG